jgi:hypothetical protein
MTDQKEIPSVGEKLRQMRVGLPLNPTPLDQQEQIKKQFDAIQK